MEESKMSKKLVAYFSASGVTAKLAKKSVMNSTLVDFSVADLFWKLIQNLLQNSLQEAVEFQLLSRALKTNRLL